jgi:hypothetical protein
VELKFDTETTSCQFFGARSISTQFPTIKLGIIL